MRRLVTSLCCATVAAVMLTASGALLKADSFAASDHPDRLARTSFAREMISQGQDPFGWEPTIMGGYPDLQFYPPGQALLGAALGILLRLDDQEAYRLVVIIAFLLPAVAVTFLMRTLGSGPLVCVVSGAVAGYMAFGQSGTVVGVGYGTIGSRLSLGFAPLMVAGFKLVHDDKAGKLGQLAIAAASSAVLLCHPYHFLPAVAAAISISHRWRSDPIRSFLRPLVGVVAGLGLAGVWWVGALIMADQTVPFAWGRMELLDAILPAHSGGIDWLLLIVGCCISLALSFTGGDRRMDAARASIPILGLVILDQVLLVGVLGVEFLDPLRLLDDLFFWTAVGSIVWVQALPRSTTGRVAAVGSTLIFAGWWMYYQYGLLGPNVVYSQPLDGYVEGPPGKVAEVVPERSRVLMTSSTYNSSHVMGWLFQRQGIEYLSGTSTHPSPLQADLLTGSGSTVVKDLADDSDDRVLLGTRWADAFVSEQVMEQLWTDVVGLGVTHVITQEGGARAPEAVLRKYKALFSELPNVGDLLIFKVEDPLPGKIVAQEGSVEIMTYSRTQHAVRITSDRPTIARFRVAAPRYWQLFVDGSHRSASVDALRQPTLQLDPGTHVVRAQYRLPKDVLVGRWVSLSIALLLLVIPTRFRRIGHDRRQPRQAGSSD